MIEYKDVVAVIEYVLFVDVRRRFHVWSHCLFIEYLNEHISMCITNCVQ